MLEKAVNSRTSTPRTQGEAQIAVMHVVEPVQGDCHSCFAAPLGLVVRSEFRLQATSRSLCCGQIAFISLIDGLHVRALPRACSCRGFTAALARSANRTELSASDAENKVYELHHCDIAPKRPTRRNSQLPLAESTVYKRHEGEIALKSRF